MPGMYTEVETPIDRDKMMKVIDALTPEEMKPMMDIATKANITEFVTDGREVASPATGSAAPPVAEPPLAAGQVPVVELAAPAEQSPVAAQVPAEQLPEELASAAGVGALEGSEPI